MNKRIFTRDELEDLEIGPHYGVVFSEPVQRTRWSIIYDLVFEHEGRHWQVAYEEGATEYQDPDPWFDKDSVEATEVELREVTVQKWVTK